MDENIDPSSPAAGGAEGGAPTEGQPQAGGEQAQQPPEPTIKDVLEQLKGFQSHVGRISAMQSRLDTLPKTLDEAVAKKLEAWQRQQQVNQLPPDERKAYEQEQTQRDSDMQALRKLISEQLEQALPEKFGASIEAGQAYQDQKTAGSFFQEIEGALGPKDMERIAPYLGQLLDKNAKEIKSEDPSVFKQASDWLEKALKNPSSVALQALKMAQEAVEKGAESVVQQRDQRGRSLSAAPRPGSGPSAPKSLKGLNPKQLEELAANMDTAEFEKLVKASKG